MCVSVTFFFLGGVACVRKLCMFSPHPLQLNHYVKSKLFFFLSSGSDATLFLSLQIARTFREKSIPCDVIWMDIDYMDGFRCFTFDKASSLPFNPYKICISQYCKLI